MRGFLAALARSLPAVGSGPAVLARPIATVAARSVTCPALPLARRAQPVSGASARRCLATSSSDATEDPYPDDVEDEGEGEIMPPSQFVAEVMQEMQASSAAVADLDAEFDGESKYELLTACIEQFEKDVPSFMLDRLATPNDAIKFFETPALPYGVREGQKPFLFDLDESSLPPNLSIDLPEKTKRARGAGA